MRTLFLGLLLLMGLPAQAADPFHRFSDAQLRIIQRQLLVAYAGKELTHDVVVDEYLRELLTTIDASDRTLIASTRKKSANAFASWGNVILVNAGMFDFARSGDELIGVLSHELAHVRLQHFTRIEENLKLLSTLSAGTLILTLLGGLASSDIAAGVSSLEKNKEYELRRRYEREADRQAVTYLVDAMLPLDGYIELLTRLGNNASSLPEYASTHPMGVERIASLRNLQRATSTSTSSNDEMQLSFLLVQERLRTRNNMTSRRIIAAHLSPLVDAYRVLLNNNGDTDAAVATLLPQQDNWLVALALAQHAARNGNPTLASDMLVNNLKDLPNNVALQAYNLELLLAAKDQPGMRYYLAAMPPLVRATEAVANLEAKFWQSVGNKFHYRVAVAHTLFYAGLIKAAHRQVREAQAMRQADEVTTAAAGRLTMLESQIALLRKQLDS